MTTNEELGIIETALYEKERYEYLDKKLNKKLTAERLNKIVNLKPMRENIGYCKKCELITERGIKEEIKPNGKRTCYRCEQPFTKMYYED